MGKPVPAHQKIGQPILTLIAKLRILSWASDNLKIGEIFGLQQLYIFITLPYFQPYSLLSESNQKLVRK